MPVNRRNYYRILHVQPEAPEQVITASYRTMMSKLRLHPDLGGETAGAALINEAYAVLKDPVKRAQYDLQRRPAPGAAARADAHEGAREAAPAESDDGLAACPFCRADAPTQIRPATRCAVCDSPSGPPPPRPAGKKELLGRRSVPRMSRAERVTLIPGWRAPARAADLLDMSLTGVRLITDLPLERHQIIRLIGPLFDVLAEVVNCRRNAGRIEVHAALRRALFKRPTGVVVSVKA